MWHQLSQLLEKIIANQNWLLGGIWRFNKLACHFFNTLFKLFFGRLKFKGWGEVNVILKFLGFTMQGYRARGDGIVVGTTSLGPKNNLIDIEIVHKILKQQSFCINFSFFWLLAYFVGLFKHIFSILRKIPLSGAFVKYGHQSSNLRHLPCVTRKPKQSWSKASFSLKTLACIVV